MLDLLQILRLSFFSSETRIIFLENVGPSDNVCENILDVLNALAKNIHTRYILDVTNSGTVTYVGVLFSFLEQSRQYMEERMM